MKENKYRLYCGAFSRAEPVGIRVFDQLTDMGSTEQIGIYGNLTNMSCLVTDGDLLITCSEGKNTDILASYRIETDGSLSELEIIHLDGYGIAHLEIDKSDKYVFASCMNSACICMVKYDSTGHIELVCKCEFDDPGSYSLGKSQSPRQASSRIHCSAVMPGGKHLMVCNMGSDKVYVLEIDKDNGRLVKIPEYTISTEAGDGPRHILFSRNGLYAYVLTELGNCIITCRIKDDNSLVICDRLSIRGEDPSVKAESSVMIESTDGRFIFAGLRGENRIIAIMATENGRLNIKGSIDCGGELPRGLIFAPDERYMFCANNGTGNIVAIPFDAESGTCGDIQEITSNVPGAANLLIL